MMVDEFGIKTLDIDLAQVEDFCAVSDDPGDRGQQVAPDALMFNRAQGMGDYPRNECGHRGFCLS
jgi:hypothetical protein